MQMLIKQRFQIWQKGSQMRNNRKEQEKKEKEMEKVIAKLLFKAK